MFGEFRDGVNRVDGGDDGTDGCGGKEAYGEVDVVGHEEEDDIIFVDAEVEETVSELGDLGFDLCKREGL